MIFLLETIYRDAKHYWSLDGEQNSWHKCYTGPLIFPDNIGHRHGYAVGNVTKSDGVFRGGVTTSRKNGWINLGIFKEECFAKPMLCKQGFSIAFWIKFSNSSRRRQYLLGTGGLRSRGDGFLVSAISNRQDTGSYVNVDVVAQNKLWKLEFPAEASTWNYITLTWSLANGLKTYLNGTLQAERIIYSVINFKNDGRTEFTLGRVNNAQKYSHASFDEIALWEKVLHPTEIKKAFYIINNASEIPKVVLQNGNYKFLK